MYNRVIGGIEIDSRRALLIKNDLVLYSTVGGCCVHGGYG